ncbi:MAG: hypothetical protein AAF609_06825 [Cyanobacteria bacterium P01_C01_bin.120]
MNANVTASYQIGLKEIEIGAITLRVFRLPNATYCLCVADVLAIENTDGAIRSALSSKIFRSPILPEAIHIAGVERTFTPVSLEAATLYWQRRTDEGNKEAHRVVKALMSKSLRERADEAFGFTTMGF